MPARHEPRPIALRRFIIADYRLGADGKRIATMPDIGPCHDLDEQRCVIRRDYMRWRATGPCFPLSVLCCVTHGLGFTVYPPGQVPYGRRAVAPVALDGSEVGAGVEAFTDRTPVAMSASAPPTCATQTSRVDYIRRQPELTAQHQIVREHWPAFERFVRAANEGRGLPAFVGKAFRAPTKSTRSIVQVLPWDNRIVPLPVELMGPQAELGHFGVADAAALLVRARATITQ